MENKTAWPPASSTKSVGKRREQESCYIILPSLNCIVNLLDRKWGFGEEGLHSEAGVGAGLPPPQSLAQEGLVPRMGTHSGLGKGQVRGRVGYVQSLGYGTTENSCG